MSSFANPALRQFRSDRKRLPLHPWERAVLTCLITHLCFLPWPLATMQTWSQSVSLGLAVLGFIFALIPRYYSSNELPLRSQHEQPTPDGAEKIATYRVFAGPRLWRFPIFWIGIALLVYITIQGLNPEWLWTRDTQRWWLIRIDKVSWLPTSVKAPLERFNVWRQLIVYASAWLTICTLWVGLTRRKSLQILLTFVLINAIVIAVVGFVQKQVSPMSFLGIYTWPINHTAFGSFIYKNHAGAYFSLITALSFSIALSIREEGVRTGKKSTPAALLFFISIILIMAVVVSLSRGATITLFAYVTGLGLWLFFRRWITQFNGDSNRIVSNLLRICFIITVIGVFWNIDSSVFLERIEAMRKDPISTVKSRLLAYDAGMVMLKEHYFYGVGAGCFRHAFPKYAKIYPEIYGDGHFFWEHIHRDWLQIPLELGIVGSLLIILGGLYFVRLFTKNWHWWHFYCLPIILGCTQTLIHAWFDFPYQCPAILITWLTILVVAVKYLEHDNMHINRQNNQ